MLREIKVFECEDGRDLNDALAFARARTDGGRTEIRLQTGCVYQMNCPMEFGQNSRVTLDMKGMAVHKMDGGRWVIKPPINNWGTFNKPETT